MPLALAIYSISWTHVRCEDMYCTCGTFDLPMHHSTSTFSSRPMYYLSILSYPQIRDCVDKYTHVFLYSVGNMRNSKLKEVRETERPYLSSVKRAL